MKTSIYDTTWLNSAEMKNVLNKICRENQNTDFMPIKRFQKIVPFRRY
jgi:hypothetical protein